MQPIVLLPLAAADPEAALRFYAANPLLRATYATRCAQVVADLEAGRLRGSRLADTATNMRLEHLRLRLGAAKGAPDEAFARLEELAQSRWLTHAERGYVWRFARAGAACEWPWLVAHVEAVLLRRAALAEQQFLQAA